MATDTKTRHDTIEPSTLSQEAQQLYSPAQTARILGRSVRSLANSRFLGTGPAFVKSGDSVFYRKVDLDAFLASLTPHMSTSEFVSARGRKRTARAA